MSSQMQCPPPTQDRRLNARNRARAVKEALYGPVRITILGKIQDLKGAAERRYWHRLARRWGLSYTQAFQRRCGSCSAYDTSAEMVACGGANASGSIGYCQAWHFTCAARRVCLSWSPRQ